MYVINWVLRLLRPSTCAMCGAELPDPRTGTCSEQCELDAIDAGSY